jgi:myo-inositol 2-dehydrogenase / D-chiro-inositol 1-dehydrogenase
MYRVKTRLSKAEITAVTDVNHDAAEKALEELEMKAKIFPDEQSLIEAEEVETQSLLPTGERRMKKPYSKP